MWWENLYGGNAPFRLHLLEYRRWYLPLSYMPHREALYAVVSVYWHDGPTTASEDSNMLRLWQTGVIVNATS